MLCGLVFSVMENFIVVYLVVVMGIGGIFFVVWEEGFFGICEI